MNIHDKAKAVNIAKIVRYLNTSGYKSKEIEDYRDVLEKSDFKFTDFIAKAIVKTRPLLRKSEGLFLYPGAHLDFDHPLLFSSRYYQFIDPIYSEISKDVIAGKIESLGIKINRISRKNDSYDVKISHAGYERNIELVAKDAVVMAEGKEGPFGKPHSISMFFLKQPATYSGHLEKGVSNISKAVIQGVYHNALQEMPIGSYYIEAGTGVKTAGEINSLNQILSGDIECWTFRADDNIMLTSAVLYQKER